MTEQMTRIAEQIKQLSQEYSESYTWGVRWDVPGLPVGHIFPASRVWVDGEPTEETLSGTAVISADNICQITAHNFYIGTPYIVCGIHHGYGEDYGEVILNECEIMALCE